MSEENNRPLYNVSTKRKRNGKDQWFNVAAIFPSRQGDGYDVLVKESFANIKGGDRLFIRPPKPRKDEEREEESGVLRMTRGKSGDAQ